MVFAENNRITVNVDLNQLCAGAHSLGMAIVLHEDIKGFQVQGSRRGGFRAQSCHLIHARALEAVNMAIKGLVVRVTGHLARSVGQRMATYEALHHLALVLGLTALLVALHLPVGRVAETLLHTVVVQPEGGSGLYVAPLVHAATLSFRDTLGPTKQEAIVTDTGLHTAGFAF